MYKARITKLTNLRKHSNADNLQVAEVFMTSVIVDLSYKEGDLVIYFPTDGKLGIEYATKNNLLRLKDEDGNNIGGYLDPDKRNITSIKLRGEKSDGLIMPIDSLSSFTDVSQLKPGDEIDVLNGVVICEKYIPKQNNRTTNSGVKINKSKNKENTYPLFKEHIDTEQLAYNLNNFKKGDIVTISLKMHGTSQRTTRTLREESNKGFKGIIKRLFNKPFRFWEVVTGTRRVVLESFTRDTSFYGTDLFRKKYHDLLKDKLHKGETVYYEVVGYTDSDKLIMNEANNKKTNDKEFIRRYGETTKFTYGCYTLPESTKLIVEDSNDPRMRTFTEFSNVNSVNVDPINKYPQNKMFVYRMTMTNEDGYIVEYPTWLVKLRCEEMGIDMVPIFEQFRYTTKADLLKRVAKYEDGPDPVGKNHIREGIVVRIENRPTFTVYKHKNFFFKVLEGITKTDAIEADMEENQ